MKRSLLSLLLGLFVLGIGAATADASVSLSAVPGVSFPSRSYLLTSSSALAASQIDVGENGIGVNNLSVQSSKSAQSRFGTVLLISSSDSMRGPRIKAALDAARTYLSLRDQLQPVGIVFFNGSNEVAAQMTVDQTKLSAAVAAAPPLAPGRKIFDGVATALQTLRTSGVTHGTIVLLSDGQDTGSSQDIVSVEKAAQAQGVPIYAIGVLAPFQGNALHGLAGATQGIYATVASKNLVGIYQQIAHLLSNQYVLTYSSPSRLGATVTVNVTVAGVGAATATYRSPSLATVGVIPATHDNSFVASNAFAVLVVLLGALLIGGGVLMVATQREGVGSRVGNFVALRGPDKSGQKSLVERALGDPSARAITKSPMWTVLVEEMDISGLTITPQQLVVATAVGMVLVGFLLATAIGSPIGALFALLVPVAGFIGIRAAADRQRRMFDDQLPDNLQVVASSMRAGNTFVGALSVVVEDAPQPSRRELRRALTDEQLGVPLADALGGVTKRMKSEDFQHVTIVATLQRDTGGNTAEVIDLVTETVRERIELRRMVRALTAQGRLAGGILTCLPFAILAIVATINSHYVHPLFHDTAGILALVAGVVMTLTGGYIIRQIVDIEV